MSSDAESATTAAADGARGGPLLEVDTLRTTFYTDKETIRAVDGVSFAVDRGETVGIVGESGSGKSVTARSIMGLVESPGRVEDESSIRFRDTDRVRAFADRFAEHTVDLSAGESLGEDAFVVIEARNGAGEVTDGYIDIARAPEAAVRRLRGGDIAMIFQDPLSSLNPVYTVGNQIKEAVRLHQGLRGTDATEEAAELLEAVGIPDAKRRLTEYPHEFSGGMRQRAVIAMALACDPEMIIADEPTTALDVTIQAQILDLLADLQRTRDLAIMFITHDMGVIAEVSDRVNVMYAGEIVESAPVVELFERPAHPYTQGLLNSIPGFQQGADRLSTIEGEVPTPTEAPTACRFAPRCPEAFEECHAIHPAAVTIDADTTDHRAACLLYPDDVPTEEALDEHERTHATEDTYE